MGAEGVEGSNQDAVLCKYINNDESRQSTCRCRMDSTEDRATMGEELRVVQVVGGLKGLGRSELACEWEGLWHGEARKYEREKLWAVGEAKYATMKIAK